MRTSPVASHPTTRRTTTRTCSAASRYTSPAEESWSSEAPTSTATCCRPMWTEDCSADLTQLPPEGVGTRSEGTNTASRPDVSMADGREWAGSVVALDIPVDSVVRDGPPVAELEPPGCGFRTSPTTLP